MRKASAWVYVLIFLLPITFATAPTHDAPLLQEITGGSETNLTGINQSGAAGTNNPIVFNYNWYHKDIKNSSRWINDTSLRGAYPFDQNNISDFSSGRNDMTKPITAPDYVVKGQIEGAFDFEQDNSDYLETVNNLGFATTDDFTYMLWIKPETQTVQEPFISTSLSDANSGHHFAFRGSGVLQLGDPDVCHVYTTSSPIVNSIWQHIAVVYSGAGANFDTTNVKFYVNGVEQPATGSCGIGPQYPSTKFTIGYEISVAPVEYIDTVMDEIYIFSKALTGAEINQTYRATRDGYAIINASRYDGVSANYRIEMTPYTINESGTSKNNTVSDTTPPSINYYNLTNEAGCENWVTDKTNPCSTSSVTPTVQFNTDEPAWCAIAGSSSSTSLNINYTQMGSSRNCTGAMPGEGGTTNHRCTLTNQDELVYDTSYLFISCKDANNNMNRSGTSTSGALKLSITGLESAGRDSIGIGIQNALLSGYINYTDQQIYARNLSNAQAKGTFDRAAKKGSKMWAFNRIGVSDSYANMFNLTPVLYNLELANKTSTNITKQVELLINATK